MLWLGIYSHTGPFVTVTMSGTQPWAPVPQVHVIQGPHVTTGRLAVLLPSETGGRGSETTGEVILSCCKYYV